MLVRWQKFRDPTCPSALKLGSLLSRLAAEFGLTPSSRSRVVVPQKPPAVVRVRQLSTELVIGRSSSVRGAGPSVTPPRGRRSGFPTSGFPAIGLSYIGFPTHRLPYTSASLQIGFPSLDTLRPSVQTTGGVRQASPGTAVRLVRRRVIPPGIGPRRPVSAIGDRRSAYHSSASRRRSARRSAAAGGARSAQAFIAVLSIPPATRSLSGVASTPSPSADW